MRMRQLGKDSTHSIAFWSSYEADVNIKGICELTPNVPVRNKHVFDFIQTNSKKLKIQNIVHWVNGAHNHTKKLASHETYENSSEKISLEKLLKECIDSEYSNWKKSTVKKKK